MKKAERKSTSHKDKQDEKEHCNLPKFELNQRCHKDFPSPFIGEVTALPDENINENGGLYKICYNDGDEEDLTPHQLKNCVAYYEKKCPKENVCTRIEVNKNKSERSFNLTFEIGTRMMKDFPRTYEAKVSKLPRFNNGRYRIRFDVDGEEEDVTPEELQILVHRKALFDDFDMKRKEDEEGRNYQKIRSNTTCTVDSSDDNGMDTVPDDTKLKLDVTHKKSGDPENRVHGTPSIKCEATEKNPASLTTSNDTLTGPGTAKLKFEDRHNEYGDNKQRAHGTPSIKCEATEKNPASLTTSNDTVTGPGTAKLKFEDRHNEYDDNKQRAHGTPIKCEGAGKNPASFTGSVNESDEVIVLFDDDCAERDPTRLKKSSNESDEVIILLDDDDDDNDDDDKKKLSSELATKLGNEKMEAKIMNTFKKDPKAEIMRNTDSMMVVNRKREAGHQGNPIVLDGDCESETPNTAKSQHKPNQQPKRAIQTTLGYYTDASKKKSKTLLKYKSSAEKRKHNPITICRPDDPFGSFTKEKFMESSIFLLNSFVDARRRINQAFGPFIRAGVATPIFGKIHANVVNRIPDYTYVQTREALLEHPDWSMSSARQVALWLHKAVVGSFVIMRQEYGNCPFLPTFLKDNLQRYIGKVYVIGVITRKIQLGSAEEDQVARDRLNEFHQVFDSYNIDKFCLVSWQRMGMKKDLEQNTQKYINAVCQPTLQQICKRSSHDAIRRDLWDKASIIIGPDDFPDVHNQDIF